MTERERFAAAMALVDRVLDATTGEREAILATCIDDAVRAEAERLLAADAAAGDFLEAPAPIGSAVGMLVQPSRATAGDRVGAFELATLLGRGGMGEVWVATRVGADFEQRVALKLLPVPGDDDAAARFRRERRILARLQHPGIAKLLDGGVTDDGRPWLAMELVDGNHLTAHCSQLDIDARLQLFAEICDVVQFAHRNLVVHRDLKPSNILVAGDGKPKLLDFGIAKLLAPSDTEADLTRTRERPMTLEYAAPEQLRGEEITIASDVWALGVILHELVVGVRPFVAKSRAETEAAILAAAPVRPSSRVQSGGPPNATPRRLRGDLDAIVLKALRPDPNARYPSAEALGTDVRRHLARTPVAARGDATSYLFRAMVRRYRAAFAVAGLAIVLLVAGIVGTLWQAHRARDQAAKAERTREFVVEMLLAFDPDQIGGKPLTQREILERGEARLGDLDDDPEDQARLLEAFAEIWYRLGEERHGLPVAARAVALERGIDPRGLRLAKVLDLEGNLEFNLTDYAASKHHFEETLALATDLEGDDGLTVALALDDLAGVSRKLTDYPRAEALRRRALAIYKARLGDRATETIGVEQNLAVLFDDEGRFEESLELQTQSCNAMREKLGATHPDTLTCLANIAHEEVQLGHYAEAISMIDKVVADETATYGADWPDMPRSVLDRGSALAGLGRYPEAIAACEEAIAQQTKHYGPDHAEVGGMYVRESLVLRDARRAADAETAARHALAICEPKVGVTSQCAGRAHSALGSALLAQSRTAEARDELTRALAIEVTALGAEHPYTRSTRAELEKLH